MHNLEELDRLQHVDPNDPSLDSVEAQMKLNLDAMKMHQDKHDDKNVTFAEYSQKKYYPFSIKYVYPVGFVESKKFDDLSKNLFYDLKLARLNLFI